MGVSINQWRSAIGCYNNNKCYQESSKPTNTSSSALPMSRMGILLYILTLVSFLTILTGAAYNSDILHTTRPPSTSPARFQEIVSTTSSWRWSYLPASLGLSSQPSPTTNAPQRAPPWPPPFPVPKVSILYPTSYLQIQRLPACPPAFSITLPALSQASSPVQRLPAWPSACTVAVPPSLKPPCSVQQLPAWPPTNTAAQLLSCQSLSHVQRSPAWPPGCPAALLTSSEAPAWTTSSRTMWLSKKQRNKLIKARNGNRQNRGPKLAHWNAGSAYLAN